MERIESKDQLISYIAGGEKTHQILRLEQSMRNSHSILIKTNQFHMTARMVFEVFLRISKNMDGNQFMKMKMSLRSLGIIN